MKIGYARVSTKKQCESLDTQISKLKKSGCKDVYSEVVSGASAKRPELTYQIKSIDDAINYQNIFRMPKFVIARQRNKNWLIREKIF